MSSNILSAFMFYLTDSSRQLFEICVILFPILQIREKECCKNRLKLVIVLRLANHKCAIWEGKTHFTDSFIFKTYLIKKFNLICPHSRVYFFLVKQNLVLLETKLYWSTLVEQSRSLLCFLYLMLWVCKKVILFVFPFLISHGEKSQIDFPNPLIGTWYAAACLRCIRQSTPSIFWGRILCGKYFPKHTLINATVCLLQAYFATFLSPNHYSLHIIFKVFIILNPVASFQIMTSLQLTLQTISDSSWNVFLSFLGFQKTISFWFSFCSFVFSSQFSLSTCLYLNLRC